MSVRINVSKISYYYIDLPEYNFSTVAKLFDKYFIDSIFPIKMQNILV
jgi:hypothetical protein